MVASVPGFFDLIEQGCIDEPLRRLGCIDDGLDETGHDRRNLHTFVRVAIQR